MHLSGTVGYIVGPKWLDNYVDLHVSCLVVYTSM